MIASVDDSRLASLRPHFPGDIPNAAVLHAVLHGANPGRVVLDDIGRPSWCVLQPVHFGFTFVGGEIPRSDLADAIGALRRQGDVALVAGIDQTWESIGAPRGDEAVERWEFSGPALRADELALRIPDGCDVRRIDAEMFARCLWRDAMVRTFGSTERYLAESVAICLVRGVDVVSEAHAVFWGVGLVEIGAVTAAAERGRGHASIVAARLIQECRARGAETTWSCDQANPASASVARKLGYRRERAYRLLEYRGLVASVT